MRSVLFLLLIATIQQYADTIDITSPPLFAGVTGVEADDVLNVREKPNSKAKKVAEIPSYHDLPLTFGVEKCKNIKSSTWCRVYPIVQNWAENFGGDVAGWVNARYLKFNNRGSVVVKGKKNCDYALKCHAGKCEVVYDYITDDEHNVIELKTRWIEREYLKGESNFGVTPDNVDGYCNNGVYIDDYLKKIKGSGYF